MGWVYHRPDYWEPLSRSLIHWDHDKKVEECLRENGFVFTTSDGPPEGGELGLGNWKLYARMLDNNQLPYYFMLMGDGTGTSQEIWMPDFGDLVSFLTGTAI